MVINDKYANLLHKKADAPTPVVVHNNGWVMGTDEIETPGADVTSPVMMT